MLLNRRCFPNLDFDVSENLKKLKLFAFKEREKESYGDGRGGGERITNFGNFDASKNLLEFPTFS